MHGRVGVGTAKRLVQRRNAVIVLVSGSVVSLSRIFGELVDNILRNDDGVNTRRAGQQTHFANAHRLSHVPSAGVAYFGF